jgi:microsomal epoxide hydrolase
LHVPGVGPDPMPLLLLHGWPGSVFEFLNIIPRLTDPARFGGDARDAFTVVAPSLPGYGLSFQPGQKRFGVPEMADCVAALMRDVLGYGRFGAQGGDWGAAVTSRLGYAYADRMIGIHINLMMAAGRDPSAFPNPNEEERRYLSELAQWMREENGYQSSRAPPQTLAFDLRITRGLAAWIVEKFAPGPCGGVERAKPGPHASRHRALLVYRGDRLVPSLLRPPSAGDLPADATISVPLAMLHSREIVRPPLHRCARVHRHRAGASFRGWTFRARQPELLADEVRAFFREL